ncbi:MAG: FHA domain-containing protein [Bdellovibrionales bacterium]|nr:FHA domain-containing protein [Bdellovibrionales bacterium]
MGLNIRILSGKRQGEEFKLRAGITIGRKSADLLIRDSKMSSLHAEVTEEDGQYFIIDKGSRNKIVHNGSPVSRLPLEDGVSFILGDTTFEIFYVNTGDVWEEELSDYLKQIERVAKNEPKEAYSFFHSIHLKVISGPDYGTNYKLCYGPRIAGKDSLDLFFHEHFEKEELFVIEEKKKSLVLRTEYPDLFTVNNSPAKSENKLADGDSISFGKTKVRIEIEK